MVNGAVANGVQPDEPEREASGGGVGARLMALPGRTKLFIALALLLPVLALAGVLRSDRGVQIERAEAIEIARPEIDFDPVTEEARLFRQGAGLRPVWAVAFTIPAEGNIREFERRTTIEVDATTGEILRIATDNLNQDQEGDN